ncbi:neocarzinostatin apoprotein domain-containing protein [Actinoplanes sp. NPDC049802]|uniref:neocarzinostatin apoprotein domain-containing protein n=1 Tax=Actinoplanes sp. NPDC049802 TaxID=3154742 RepID=UPI0033D1E3AB
MVLPRHVRRPAASVAAALICAVTIVLADSSPALAAPELHVSKTSGIADGEKITVYGTGFKAGLTDLALGQCIADPATATDCNLTGGAEFVSTDDSGKTKTLTLTIAKSWSDGAKNCDDGCVIAAQLLPSSHSEEDVAANKVQVKITFGAGGGGTTSPTKTATPTKTSTSTKSATAGSSKSSTAAAGALPKTGPGQEWATVVLIGSALLLPGAGLLILLPARRRRMAGFQ